MSICFYKLHFVKIFILEVKQCYPETIFRELYSTLTV